MDSRFTELAGLQVKQDVKDRTVSRGVPQGVAWATLIVVAHGVQHLLVPLLMELQRDLFVAQFQHLNPSQTLDQVVATVNIVLRAGLIYHLILAALFLWLALMIREGRNWARVVVTIVSILGAAGTFFSFSSPTPSPELYKTLNIISWLLASATIGLLWLPQRSRSYFAKS